MRLVFAGTPDAAVPSLEALAASSHEVVAVVTRPDAPAGRGRSLVPSPVRVRADALGLPVLTPATAKDPAFHDQLRELAPDACPVVAYGAIVPRAALDIPRHGWVNLHFSLLPAWRGAAPVQRAVMAGDDVTGATTFVLEEERRRSGDVLAGHHRALHGGSAPPGGEQREVQVHPAVSRDVERRSGDDRAVGDDRAGVGRHLAQPVVERRVLGGGGGEHRHTEGFGAYANR